MNKEEITITGLIRLIESGEGKNIRLRNWQLAQLFGVYEATIRANVKTIIRTGVVAPCIDCEVILSGSMIIPESHDLNMIIALAFQLNSENAYKLREWIMEKLFVSKNNLLIHIGLDNPQFLN